jgi:3-dehydroquinate synthetase
MGHDKKVQDGVLHFVLLEALGRASVRSDVTRSALAEVLA